MTLYCTVSKMCWPKVANFPTQSSLQVAAQGVTLRILQLGSESETNSRIMWLLTRASTILMQCRAVSIQYSTTVKDRQTDTQQRLPRYVERRAAKATTRCNRRSKCSTEQQLLLDHTSYSDSPTSQRDKHTHMISTDIISYTLRPRRRRTR